MIVVKSRMRKMPTCCRKCVYYKHSPIIKTFYDEDGICTADGYLTSMQGVDTSKRSLRCPLIEQKTSLPERPKEAQK